jgi:hypothetical protein
MTEAIVTTVWNIIINNFVIIVMNIIMIAPNLKRGEINEETKIKQT